MTEPSACGDCHALRSELQDVRELMGEWFSLLVGKCEDQNKQICDLADALSSIFRFPSPPSQAAGLNTSIEAPNLVRRTNQHCKAVQAEPAAVGESWSGHGAISPIPRPEPSAVDPTSVLNSLHTSRNKRRRQASPNSRAGILQNLSKSLDAKNGPTTTDHADLRDQESPAIAAANSSYQNIFLDSTGAESSHAIKAEFADDFEEENSSLSMDTSVPGGLGEEKGGGPGVGVPPAGFVVNSESFNHSSLCVDSYNAFVSAACTLAPSISQAISISPLLADAIADSAARQNRPRCTPVCEDFGKRRLRTIRGIIRMPGPLCTFRRIQRAVNSRTVLLREHLGVLEEENFLYTKEHVSTGMGPHMNLAFKRLPSQVPANVLGEVECSLDEYAAGFEDVQPWQIPLLKFHPDFAEFPDSLHIRVAALSAPVTAPAASNSSTASLPQAAPIFAAAVDLVPSWTNNSKTTASSSNS